MGTPIQAIKPTKKPMIKNKPKAKPVGMASTAKKTLKAGA